MDNVYSFASRPRPVNRKKYRENPEADSLSNDPRVSRSCASNRGIEMRSSNQSERKPRKTTATGSLPISIYGDKSAAQSTSIPISLEQYLVEHLDSVDEKCASTQTDTFTSNDIQKSYTPERYGIDAATQIEPEDNLFHFDHEVMPILDVIVSKTMDQALLEVEDEVEMERIMGHLQHLEAAAENESRLALQCETDVKQAFFERSQAIAIAKKRMHGISQINRKITARIFSSSLVTSVVDSVNCRLEMDGFFFNPIEQKVETDFLEWIYSNADLSVQRKQQGDKILDDALVSSLQSQSHLYSKDGFIRISVAGMGLGLDVIGPIAVSGDETLLEVENLIEAWMEEHNEGCIKPENGYLSLVQSGSPHWLKK